MYHKVEISGFTVSRFQSFKVKGKSNSKSKPKSNYPTSAKGRQKWGTLESFVSSRPQTGSTLKL
jgi:hypothetical protein